jgi:hypothetical protein
MDANDPVGLHGSGKFAPPQMCQFLRDIIRRLPAAQKGEYWNGCISPSD